MVPSPEFRGLEFPMLPRAASFAKKVDNAHRRHSLVRIVGKTPGVELRREPKDLGRLVHKNLPGLDIENLREASGASCPPSSPERSSNAWLSTPVREPPVVPSGRVSPLPPSSLSPRKCPAGAY